MIVSGAVLAPPLLQLIELNLITCGLRTAKGKLSTPKSQIYKIFANQ